MLERPNAKDLFAVSQVDYSWYGNPCQRTGFKADGRRGRTGCNSTSVTRLA